MKTISLGKDEYKVVFENEKGFIGQHVLDTDCAMVFVKSDKALHGFKRAGETIDQEMAEDAQWFRQDAGCYLFSINPVGYDLATSEIARKAVIALF